MAIKSGFFNSQAGDRLYDAEDINDFFEGFVTDGVLAPVGSWLQVTVGGGLSVVVGDGKAWFRNSWIKNTQPLTLNLATADANYGRWDVVALDFDSANRVNDIVVITGTPDQQNPQPPTLLNTETRLQVPLAHVAVLAGATSIFANNITNKIGVDPATPFCTGLLQQASIDDLMLQYTSDYYDWRYSIQSNLEEIDTTGTLQELSDIRVRTARGRNFIINGSFIINQLGKTQVTGYNRAMFLSDPFALMDRWSLRLSSTNSGTWTLSKYELAGEYGFRAAVSTAGGTLGPNDHVVFKQVIESGRISEIRKGTADAKPMVLSFDFRTNKSGTYVVELKDPKNSRSISHSFYHPGDGGEDAIEWAIPPDFTGKLPQNTDSGIELNFWLAAGSDYSGGASLLTEWDFVGVNQNRRAYGQVNGITTVGKYYEWRNVQLEIGSVATPFESRSLEEELRDCRRYMEYHSQWNQHASGFSGTNKVDLWVIGKQYLVEKRDVPAITATGWLSHATAGFWDSLVDKGQYGASDDPLHKIELRRALEIPLNGSDGIRLIQATDLIIDAEYAISV